MTFVVQVPNKLTREQREILEAFDRTMEDIPNAGDSGKNKKKKQGDNEFRIAQIS